MIVNNDPHLNKLYTNIILWKNMNNGTQHGLLFLQ